MSLNGNFGRCGGPPTKGTSANPYAGQAGPFQLEGKRSGKGESRHTCTPSFAARCGWNGTAGAVSARNSAETLASFVLASSIFGTPSAFTLPYKAWREGNQCECSPSGTPVRPLLIHFPRSRVHPLSPPSPRPNVTLVRFLSLICPGLDSLLFFEFTATTTTLFLIVVDMRSD
jgi:hypothetical protein